MDASQFIVDTVSVLAVLSFIALIICAIYDDIKGNDEDWYDFDEIEGHVFGLKKDYPVETEFTGWTMLVHVKDDKGRTHLFKTSPLLYRKLDEEIKYNFFIRDNQIWKVIEVESKLTFKAK